MTPTTDPSNPELSAINMGWYYTDKLVMNHVFIIYIGIDLVRTACGFSSHRSELQERNGKDYCLQCETIMEAAQYE